jgi:hypothetical protein
MSEMRMKALAIAALAGSLALTACGGGDAEGGPDTDGSSDIDGGNGDGGVDADAGDPDAGDSDTVDPDAGDTDVIDPDGGDTDVIDPDGGDTDVIDPDGGDTDVIDPDGGDTDVIDPDGGDTDVVDPDAGDTDVVDPDAGDTDVVDPDGGDTDAGDTDGGTDTGTPVCGNGVVESGEECDNGEDNDARLPDACRPVTCEVASCGDGVTDSGEQCDDGAANGADAACSLTCAINLDVACDGIDLLDADLDGDVVGGVTFVSSSVRAGTGDSTPPVDCGDAATSGAESVISWQPTENGIYRISTDVPATVADTVVYVTDSCVDGTPLVCNDDNGTSLSSTVFFDVTDSSRPYFIVVDSNGTAGGAYALSIELVPGVAGEGEDCASLPCDAGLVCAGDVCNPLSAPVLDLVTGRTTATGTVRFNFEGSDLNLDVDNIQIIDVTYDDGDVYGDAADEGVLNLINPIVPTYVGFDYTFPVTLALAGLSTSGTAVAVEATFAVTDAAGLVSEQFTAPIDPFTEPVEVGDGAACDFTGLDSVCAAGLTCQYNTAGETVCGTPAAPVLTGLELVWISETDVNHIITGTDPDLDVATILADIGLSDGSRTGELDFVWDTVEVDGPNFVLELALTGFGGGEAVDVDILVEDAEGNRSNTLSADYGAPVILDAGDACGGAITGVCGEGLLCSPTLTGGSVCATDSAPVLTRVEAFYDTATSLTAEFDGSDINADVVSIEVRAFQNSAGGILVTDPIPFDSADLTPAINGRLAFRSQIPSLGTGGTVFSQLEIVLIDSQGNRSAAVLDPLGTEGAEGDGCTADGSIGCGDGLVCNPSLTCGVAEAPVAINAFATRISDSEIIITVTGSDVNADALFMLGNAFDLEGNAFLNDAGVPALFGFDFDTPVSGLTSFEATITTEVPATLGSLSLYLVDFTDLESNAVTFDVPLVVAVGGACSNDPEVDFCASPSSCIAGICTVDSAEPCGPGIVIADLTEDFELTGSATATGDVSATSSLSTVCAGVDGEGLGGEAFFSFTAPEDGRVILSTDNTATEELDTTLFANEGVCTVSDPPICDDDGGVLGFTSTLVFDVTGGTTYYIILDTWEGQDVTAYQLDATFTIPLGPAEPCTSDVDCATGLYCNDADSLCTIPDGGTCGFDTVLVDADGIGTSPWTAAVDNLVAPEACTGSAGGPEIIFEYTAPVTGAYQAGVVGPADVDSVLYVTRGVCESSVLVCNDDFDPFAGDFFSVVDFNGVAGLTYYLVVETYDGADPSADIELAIFGP